MAGQPQHSLAIPPSAMTDADNPLNLFHHWLQAWCIDAQTDTSSDEATACCLATVDRQGRPDARMVLLKNYNENGFDIYTDMTSSKSHHLNAMPYATLCFYWPAQGRQIRISGQCQKIPATDADAYFHSRHRKSQIGAWASQQSRPLHDDALAQAVRAYTNQFSQQIPRPNQWAGWRLMPAWIEFWQQGHNRLHQRTRYIRKPHRRKWHAMQLFP